MHFFKLSVVMALGVSVMAAALPWPVEPVAVAIARALETEGRGGYNKRELETDGRGGYNKRELETEGRGGYNKN